MRLIGEARRGNRIIDRKTVPEHQGRTLSAFDGGDCLLAQASCFDEVSLLPAQAVFVRNRFDPRCQYDRIVPNEAAPSEMSDEIISILEGRHFPCPPGEPEAIPANHRECYSGVS